MALCLLSAPSPLNYKCESVAGGKEGVEGGEEGGVEGKRGGGGEL